MKLLELIVPHDNACDKSNIFLKIYINPFKCKITHLGVITHRLRTTGLYIASQYAFKITMILAKFVFYKLKRNLYLIKLKFKLNKIYKLQNLYSMLQYELKR